MILMMNKKSYAALLLSGALLFSPLATHSAQAASSDNYKFQIITKTDQYSSVLESSASMRNGTLYVDFNYMGSMYGLTTSFDATGKRAGFNGWKKKIGVRDGSKTAIVDGKLVTMSKPAYFIKNKESKETEVYLPFKFVVEAMGGTYIGYDAKNKAGQATNLQDYNVITASHAGMTYTVEKSGGNVFVQKGKDIPVQITTLKGDLDAAELNVRTTPKGLTLLTVSNSYGEPHINSETYQVLLKDGKLLRQNHADFHWGRPDLIDTYNGNILMNDSKKLRVIEDGTGNVLDTIDLLELGGLGADQQYNVEGMDDDILLIRSGRNYELLLVDRHTKRSIAVYKEVLSAAQQKEVEMELADSGPFSGGDRLTFKKRVGNLLFFNFQSPTGEGPKSVTYDLSKLSGK